MKKSKATEQELRDFCREQGLPESDGETLFLKWEGNGWLNGKNPIKDWKATIRCWRNQGFLPSQRSGSPSAVRGGGLVTGWGTKQERRA